MMWSPFRTGCFFIDTVASSGSRSGMVGFFGVGRAGASLASCCEARGWFDVYSIALNKYYTNIHNV